MYDRSVASAIQYSVSEDEGTACTTGLPANSLWRR